jgi:hypothetical protein
MSATAYLLWFPTPVHNGSLHLYNDSPTTYSRVASWNSPRRHIFMAHGATPLNIGIYIRHTYCLHVYVYMQIESEWFDSWIASKPLHVIRHHTTNDTTHPCCIRTPPLHDGSLHLYNDSPSSQWLPTPVQRFTLFNTMAPYTCTMVLPDGTHCRCMDSFVYMYGNDILH